MNTPHPMISQELSNIISKYMPMVEALDKVDVFLLETIRQLLFATDFGYLEKVMESIDITCQAQLSMMEQYYEQGQVPEQEE